MNLILGVSVLALVLSFTGVAGAQETSALQLQIQKQQQRLGSSDAEERRDAVMRLGALRDPAASRIAASALKDASIQVRVAATTAILWLPADESAALLAPLLNDKDIFVRQETSYALGKTRSRSAGSPLIALLGTEMDSGVRGAIIVALGEIGDETAVVPLAQILAPELSMEKKKSKPENEFILRAAARSLGQIRSRSGLPALIAALQNEANEIDVRREAANALGLIGDRSSISALRNALNHADPYLAEVAHNAIRHIESQSP